MAKTTPDHIRQDEVISMIEEAVLHEYPNLRRISESPMQPDHRKSRTTGPLNPDLAREAKAIVALAFRNGTIEDLHAGIACPTCQDNSQYSRISDAEMKQIMQNAVNHVYLLLWQRTYDPGSYARRVEFGDRYTGKWNDPEGIVLATRRCDFGRSVSGISTIVAPYVRRRRR